MHSSKVSRSRYLVSRLQTLVRRKIWPLPLRRRTDSYLLSHEGRYILTPYEQARAGNKMRPGGFRRFFHNVDGQTYGRTDTPSYRDGRTHLKSNAKKFLFFWERSFQIESLSRQRRSVALPLCSAMESLWKNCFVSRSGAVVFRGAQWVAIVFSVLTAAASQRSSRRGARRKAQHLGSWWRVSASFRPRASRWRKQHWRQPGQWSRLELERRR